MPTRLLAGTVVSLLLATCFLIDVNPVDAQTKQSRAVRPLSARTGDR